MPLWGFSNGTNKKKEKRKEKKKEEKNITFAAQRPSDQNIGHLRLSTQLGQILTGLLTVFLG